jgi:hypothetical protein
MACAHSERALALADAEVVVLRRERDAAESATAEGGWGVGSGEEGKAGAWGVKEGRSDETAAGGCAAGGDPSPAVSDLLRELLATRFALAEAMRLAGADGRGVAWGARGMAAAAVAQGEEGVGVAGGTEVAWVAARDVAPGEGEVGTAGAKGGAKALAQDSCSAAGAGVVAARLARGARGVGETMGTSEAVRTTEALVASSEGRGRARERANGALHAREAREGAREGASEAVQARAAWGAYSASALVAAAGRASVDEVRRILRCVRPPTGIGDWKVPHLGIGGTGEKPPRRY